MITFRQKEFFAPLVGGALSALGTIGNVATIASIPMGIKQANDQKKLAKEQAEQQEEQNLRTVKALNNVANQAANNPQTAQAAANIMNQSQNRLYSKIPKIKFKGLKNVAKEGGLFAKNIGTIINENKTGLIGGTMAGVGMAGTSYLTDKAIQYDMKRSGIPLERKAFSKSSSIMKGLKSTGKVLKDSFKKSKTMIGTTAILGALPTGVGYLSSKKAMKDQASQSQNDGSQPVQTMYSFNFRGIGKYLKTKGTKIGNGINKFVHDPVTPTLNVISSFSGGGGLKGVQDVGKRLSELGVKSNSKFTKKAGDFIQSHPKTSLLGSIPVGAAIMGVTWDAGEKATNKLLRKADKNAYRYQDSMNQEVEQ